MKVSLFVLFLLNPQIKTLQTPQTVVVKMKLSAVCGSLGSGSPFDTEVHICSSPLWKMAWYLHMPHTILFVSLTDFLKYLIS